VTRQFSIAKGSKFISTDKLPKSKLVLRNGSMNLKNGQSFILLKNSGNHLHWCQNQEPIIQNSNPSANHKSPALNL
jgi:hypothetical protein